MTKSMNLKSKIAKGVLAGTCFTLISAGSAFAAESGAGSEPVLLEYSVESSALAEKHREIDHYIFEQGGLEKFQEMGFTVTTTGPHNDVIEIGITPYEESYAEVFYDLFGSDQVKVVEGVQAVTLMADDAASGASDGDAGFSTMVVGGPEPGEGEAAITSIDPNEPVSDEAVRSGIVEDAQLISAPLDDEEVLPISAPVESGAESGAQATTNVWPWVAGAVAALAAAALIIRKAVAKK